MATRIFFPNSGVAEPRDEPLAIGSETPCNMLRNHFTIQQCPNPLYNSAKSMTHEIRTM